MRRIVLAAALAGAVLSAPIAEAVPLHTSAFFFGDSLTDPGNLYAATGGARPLSPPYSDGRFSNGPIWAESIAAKYAARGLATANYAYGGATAVTNGDAVPDLTQQLAMFGASKPATIGKKPVAALWFGANDVLDTIQATPTPEAVAAAAAKAAAAVVGGIKTLRGLGVKDVVILNLPSLEETPAFALFQPAAAPLAKLGSDVFNTTLADLLSEMKGKRRIATVDVDYFFSDLIANPTKYGVVNATIPCIIPGVSVCKPEVADALAFFDPLHPNEVVHAELGAIVAADMAPVPLPASVMLMLAGLGGLSLVGLRRRAA